MNDMFPGSMATKTSKTSAKPPATEPAKAQLPMDAEAARARVSRLGRNDDCPCGSEKKYKKCHLHLDEAAAFTEAPAPDAGEHLKSAWRLFEQRRPGAAEKEFRTALGLSPGLPEARVGLGLAKLSSGDTDGAQVELESLVKDGAPVLDKLRAEKATDGFSRTESQPYLRAAHALGCLHYDKDRFEETLVALEPVQALDAGPVGIEARLIMGKTLIKLTRPADAVPILEGAAKDNADGGRAQMGLALAQFLAGDKDKAKVALNAALGRNSHFAKAVLGHIRQEVSSPVGAPAGSKEEAVVYSQTYGDVWDDAARQFLKEALEGAAG